MRPIRAATRVRGSAGSPYPTSTRTSASRPEIPTNIEPGVRASLFDRKLTVERDGVPMRVRDFRAQVADLSSASICEPDHQRRVPEKQGRRVQHRRAPDARSDRSAGGGAYVDARYGRFREGVQCHFGQPKVAQGGPCVAPPANPNPIGRLFRCRREPARRGRRRFSYNLVADYQRSVGHDLRAQFQVNFSGQLGRQLLGQWRSGHDPEGVRPAGHEHRHRGGVTAAGASVSIAINLLDKLWAAQKNPSPVTTLNPGGYLQYLSPDAVRTVGVTLDFRHLILKGQRHETV